MEHAYYKIPLNLSGLFDGNNSLKHCTLMESIDQHLELILTTCPGEHAFNPEFGCGTWDLDFDRVVSRSHWEEQFADLVHKAVTENERRITNVQIKIKMNDIMWEDVVAKSTTMRKKVDVFILGNLVSTGQNCGFKHTIYMGPMSTE